MGEEGRDKSIIVSSCIRLKSEIEVGVVSDWCCLTSVLEVEIDYGWCPSTRN